jgi:hypothetical protein
MRSIEVSATASYPIMLETALTRGKLHTYVLGEYLPLRPDRHISHHLLAALADTHRRAPMH